VLAHDTSADPLFVYANRAAQRAFGYTWEEFVGMPSRLSAEAPERAERQRLLDAVARDGFVSGYSGIRVARDGRRFPVSEGIVWQLVDEAGTVHGQAATFPLAA
jgi:PAS domain S-box-containing protein